MLNKLLRFTTTIAMINLMAIVAVPTEFKLLQSLELGSSATAAPSQRVRWVPKKRIGSVRSTLSGGRRGRASTTCDYGKGVSPTSLTLLVPSANDGLYTTAANPAFFWYINTEKAVSAKFILSDPNRAEPIFTQTLQISHSGISRVELPASTALQVGTQYRWTVLLACKEGTSSDVYARSSIERVDDPTLRQKVANQSDYNQAVSYANEGIWYDAFDSLIRANQENPGDVTLEAELKSLLAQVGSAPVTLARQEIQVIGQL